MCAADVGKLAKVDANRARVGGNRRHAVARAPRGEARDLELVGAARVGRDRGVDRVLRGFVGSRERGFVGAEGERGARGRVGGSHVGMMLPVMILGRLPKENERLRGIALGRAAEHENTRRSVIERTRLRVAEREAHRKRQP